MLSIWHCTFAMPKHTDIISWLAGNNDEMVIYAFLLGFSSPSYQKKMIQVLSTNDYLILLITNTSHKAHLFSCALRCSSKLQEIQSLETLFQRSSKVHKYQYTQTHCFCIFFYFPILFNDRQSKEKLKTTKTKTWNKTHKA